ncbi:hypothetical protein ACLKA6_001635 [Drosophila palustris]
MKGLLRPVASSSSFLRNPSVRIGTQDRPLPAADAPTSPMPGRLVRSVDRKRNRPKFCPRTGSRCFQAWSPGGIQKNRKWNRPKFYSWIAPEYQVRPVGAILRPPPRARRPGCGSKSQAQSHPLPKTLGGRSQEREPELTKLAFQGSLNAVQIRPPGPIRGQKAEQTKIPSTNRIQVLPGLVPGEDPGTENGTDRDSVPGSSPDHQVRPVAPCTCTSRAVFFAADYLP